MNNTQINPEKPSKLVVEFIRYFSLLVSKIFWRIEFINTENIPKDLDTGFIVAPNHQTYFDPFWVCIPIKNDMRFMAWDDAFNMFFISRLLNAVGAFPVSLNKGGTIKALKDSLKFLREGKALLIFPEGQREFANGKLLRFKTGAVRLALETNVPILPVTVLGGNKIWSRDHKFPRPMKIKIIYHPIIKFQKSDKSDNLQVLTDQLKKIIASEM